MTAPDPYAWPDVALVASDFDGIVEPGGVAETS